jgi:hypothetical protein
MTNVNPAIPDAPTKATDRPGYEFDPYGAQNQFDDIHAPTIPFHNYRQIHVSQNAWWAGMRATSIKEIPDCPPLWGDVPHYWKTVSLAGYFGYEFLTKDALAIKIGTVIGSAGLLEIARKFVLPMVGVTI